MSKEFRLIPEMKPLIARNRDVLEETVNGIFKYMDEGQIPDDLSPQSWTLLQALVMMEEMTVHNAAEPPPAERPPQAAEPSQPEAPEQRSRAEEAEDDTLTAVQTEKTVTEEPKPHITSLQQLTDILLEEYPKAGRKNIKKTTAYAAVQKNVKIEEADAVLEGLKKWKSSGRWSGKDNKHVPMFSVFLMERKWELEPNLESGAEKPKAGEKITDTDSELVGQYFSGLPTIITLRRILKDLIIDQELESWIKWESKDGIKPCPLPATFPLPLDADEPADLFDSTYNLYDVTDWLEDCAGYNDRYEQKTPGGIWTVIDK